MKKVIIALVLLFSLSTVLTSCREQKTAGEKIEEAVEEVGDELGDAVEEVEDEIDDATH